MFAKFNSSENGVNINKIVKNQESLSNFNVEEDKNFPKICKQSSEVNFHSKNLQICNGSNKLGKSMLRVSKNILYVYSVLLVV